jgi:hypothetical protein
MLSAASESNQSRGYGWVAGPYPTGTLIRQEMPSFARVDNVKRSPRDGAA